MTKIDRYYLESNPEVIVKVAVPSRVTLWVPREIDQEADTIEASRVYVALNESKCRLNLGTPLAFEFQHTFYLDAGTTLWAITRDQALVAIQVDSIN